MLHLLLTLSFQSFSDALECPKGFIQGGNGDPSWAYCFTYFNENANWTDAEKRCEEIKDLRWEMNGPGHLASVDDDALNSVIEQHGCSDAGLAAYPHGVWIGGSRGIQSNKWGWVDGAPLSFTYWAKGQSL